jgi:hypothetical protein
MTRPLRTGWGSRGGHAQRFWFQRERQCQGRPPRGRAFWARRLALAPARRWDPAADAYGRLAKTCDRIATTNESHIELLGRVFTLASAAIIVEVLLWGLQLALT